MQAGKEWLNFLPNSLQARRKPPPPPPPLRYKNAVNTKDNLKDIQQPVHTDRRTSRWTDEQMRRETDKHDTKQDRETDVAYRGRFDLHVQFQKEMLKIFGGVHHLWMLVHLLLKWNKYADQ